MRLSHLITLCNRIAPETLAEEWDHVGLQCGDPEAEVSKLLLCLDLTDAVLAEARALDAECILSHHPLLFRPVFSLREDRYPARLLAGLIRSGIAAYAMHTNLDSTRPGTSDALAEALGIVETEPLVPAARPAETAHYKLAVFVPAADADRVRKALGDAGAGALGNYSHCSFSARGTGSFRPLEGAHPAIGSIGTQEYVPEEKVEVIVPKGILPRVLDAMLAAHPYEEVAYDLLPLGPPPTGAGLGRFGRMETPCTVEELAERARACLPTSRVALAGDPGRRVERVAVCGGAGGDLVDAAAAAGADLLLTGDVKHHQAHHALERGLAVIDAGHYGTERPVLDLLARLLRENAGDALEVHLSRVCTDPFT